MWGWSSRYDWFDKLMGFTERSYEYSKSKMAVETVNGEQMLKSLESGKSYGCGELELVSLEALRARVAALPQNSLFVPGSNKLKLSCEQGDVRRMHPNFPGALFQVASQFNLLEMVGPGVTPEDGVSGYAGDPTQGPACAIACGAGTIYRNYFAPVRGQIGQTTNNQLDGSEVLGDLLAQKMGVQSRRDLWKMRNGYLMPSRESLAQIDTFLSGLDEAAMDELRRALAIGLHWNVEITDGREDRRKPLYVSQAYCSALPVSYCGHGRETWTLFATLILESLYESTLLAGVLNALRPGGSNIVMLTQVGGGAFGNSRFWIEKAMRRALALFRDWDLDVRVVCYGGPDAWVEDMIDELMGREKKVLPPPPSYFRYEPSKTTYSMMPSSSDEEDSSSST